MIEPGLFSLEKNLRRRAATRRQKMSGSIVAEVLEEIANAIKEAGADGSHETAQPQSQE